MKNKKCIAEQFVISTYSEYNSRVNLEDRTKEGCESIVSTNIYEKCSFNEGTHLCNSQKLPCTDYTITQEMMKRFVGYLVVQVNLKPAVF